MDFSKFTTKASEAMQGTMELAEKLHQQALSPLHLLLVLLQQPEGLVPTILEKLEQHPEAIVQRIQTELAKQPTVEGGRSYVSQELKIIFDKAESEAGKLHDEYILSLVS